MTPFGFTLISCSVLLSALGQTCFKAGVARSILPEGATILIKAITMLTSPWVLAGLSCYSVGMVLWLFALRHVDLSLAYPFVAMSFVVVTIMAVVFLGETLAPARIAGLSMIVLGLSVMALWG